MMQLSLIDESEMTAQLDQRIRDALCVCFPADREAFSQSRAWHGSAPAYSALLQDGDQIVGHVGVVDRTISVGGTAVRAAGVQNVFVLPNHRGKGLSARLMDDAMREAAVRRFSCGLLFCVPSLEPVYVRCGWRSLGFREVVRVENGRELPIPGKNITMFYPLHLVALPDGLIHLQGNDW
jgi:predicted N-acetyltransferase YhbS